MRAVTVGHLPVAPRLQAAGQSGRNITFDWCGRRHLSSAPFAQHPSRAKGAAMRRKVMVAAVATATFFGVAACGGGSSDDNSSSSGLNSRGPITYVQGKDNSNVVRPTIAKWNKAHPDEKVTFKEQTDQADQQHDDLVPHFQAKDPHYDLVDVDVVWTAEFAAKGWLQPLTGNFALDTSKLLPATVKTGTYNG